MTLWSVRVTLWPITITLPHMWPCRTNIDLGISAPNPVEADAFQTILTHELHKVQAKLEEFATYMKELKVRSDSVWNS